MTDEEKQPEPPEGVIVASNGAWRDATTGQFVKGMPATDNAFTPENSIDIQHIRRQKQLEGMIAADKRLYDIDPDYWGGMVESMYNLACQEKGTGSVKGAELAGRMTGNLASSAGSNGSDPVPPGGGRVDLGEGVMERLHELLVHAREGKE